LASSKCCEEFSWRLLTVVLCVGAAGESAAVGMIRALLPVLCKGVGVVKAGGGKPHWNRTVNKMSLYPVSVSVSFVHSSCVCVCVCLQLTFS
jgi:hypothetical protein